MKQNKFIKYGLIAMFLVIGIFGLNIDVEAAKVGKICNYTFDTMYANDISVTVNFQLKLVKIDSYANRYEIISNSVGISPRHSTADGKIYVYYKDNANICPSVLIYQRREKSLVGQVNLNKYYILSDVDSENETSSALISACQGKNDDEEVLSGYRCGNKIGPISGTASTPNTECTTSDFNGVTKKVESSFTPVTNSYNDFKSRMESQSIDASGSTAQQAKQICGELKNTANSYVNQLLQKYNSLGIPNLIKKYASESYSCLPTENQVKKIENDFTNKMKNYSRKILGIADTKYAECLATSNATAEEVEDAVEDAKESSEEKVEKVSDSVKNEFNELIEELTEITMNDVDEIDCEGLLGDELLDLIAKLLNYVQIAAPILLIVLGIVDFSQAVLSDDKDALKKATNKFVKRAIICVAIFFLPLIINYILKLIDGMPKDPMCGLK